MHNGEAPANGILALLPPEDWAALQPHADRVALRTGTTIHLPDAPISTVYFPDTGVVSVVAVLTSGDRVEIAAIGREGFIGAASLFDRASPCWMVVQVESCGYRMPADVFTRAFHERASVRRLALAHVGRMIRELARSAACNRFHSHEARLARWLYAAMTKSGHTSLDLTHDFIAQMVGGPRHAVTKALNDLRAAGVIDSARGRIDILDVDRLAAQACECQSPAAETPAV